MLSDSAAANLFLCEFSLNFTAPTCQPVRAAITSSLLELNYNATTVIKALRDFSCSNSSPDGMGFKLLKHTAKFIVFPLTVIFQHAFHDGIFPSCWKYTIVIPLYKGRGDKNLPSLYRPISLCASLGKILEKVDSAQLKSFLNQFGNLHKSQYGFNAGRSTVTNLLASDAYISQILSCDHSYNIISFDFRKAFEKVPHPFVIQMLSDLGVGGKSLNWFNSFLSDRIFSVKVGSSYSTTADVSSGVIEGLVLRPNLYTIFINLLLNSVLLPVEAFADALKFITDTTEHNQVYIKTEIDIVTDFSSLY